MTQAQLAQGQSPLLAVRDVSVGFGAHSTAYRCMIGDWFRLAWVRRSESTVNKKVNEILAYLKLEDVPHTPVSGLPFGTQKRVEWARALAADPKILLLDEPAG